MAYNVFNESLFDRMEDEIDQIGDKIIAKEQENKKLKSAKSAIESNEHVTRETKATVISALKSLMKYNNKKIEELKEEMVEGTTIQIAEIIRFEEARSGGQQSN